MDREAWLHGAEGVLAINGVPLVTGDGASTVQPGALSRAAIEQTEAILFDLKDKILEPNL